MQIDTPPQMGKLFAVALAMTTLMSSAGSAGSSTVYECTIKAGVRATSEGDIVDSLFIKDMTPVTIDVKRAIVDWGIYGDDPEYRTKQIGDGENIDTVLEEFVSDPELVSVAPGFHDGIIRIHDRKRSNLAPTVVFYKRGSLMSGTCKALD